MIAFPRCDERTIREQKFKYINTCKFLNLVSKHLSNIESCKHVEYRMEIYSEYDDGYKFNSNVRIFPDVYHRKESDKDTVVDHVLKYHMPELVKEFAESNIVLDSSKLIIGEYIYRMSFNNKRRKWIKLSTKPPIVIVHMKEKGEIL